MFRVYSCLRALVGVVCLWGASVVMAHAMDISVTETAALLERDAEVLLLDIREDVERQQGYIPGTVHLPMGQIQYNLDKLPRDKKIILTCRTGNRTGQMTRLLRQQGFDNVYNMVGGIVAWAQAGRPVVAATR